MEDNKIKDYINEYMNDIIIPENINSITKGAIKMAKQENRKEDLKLQKKFLITLAACFVLVFAFAVSLNASKNFSNKVLQIPGVRHVARFLLIDKTEEEMPLEEVDNTQNKIEISEKINETQSKDDNKNTTINFEKLEVEIKGAIIKIAKDDKKGLWGYNNSIYAEAHKTLKAEIVNNQVYAYIVATLGTYTPKDNGEYQLTSSMQGPMLLIFDITDGGNYMFIDYKEPEEGENWSKTLKEIFPSDLLNEIYSVNYNTDFYKTQINQYLNKNTVNTNIDNIAEQYTQAMKNGDWDTVSKLNKTSLTKDSINDLKTLKITEISKTINEQNSDKENNIYCYDLKFYVSDSGKTAYESGNNTRFMWIRKVGAEWKIELTTGL